MVYRATQEQDLQLLKELFDKDGHRKHRTGRKLYICTGLLGSFEQLKTIVIMVGCASGLY